LVDKGLHAERFDKRLHSEHISLSRFVGTRGADSSGRGHLLIEVPADVDPVDNWLSSRTLADAVRDNSDVPFSATEEVLEAFNSSLRDAPEELRKVADRQGVPGGAARAHGWSVLAAWGQPGSRVPPIQTVKPQ